MQFEVLMRFAIGLLLGACIWAVSHRARADSIPATADTQTQPATQTTVAKYSVTYYESTIGWFSSVAGAQTGYVSYRNSTSSVCSTNGSGSAYESFSAGGIYSGYFEVKSTCGPYPDGTYQWVDLITYTYYVQQNFTEYQCPSDWTLSGSNCTKTTYSCPAGYTLNGTMCDQNPPPVKPAGESCGNMAIPASASPGAGGCVDGTLCYFDQASNQYAVGGSQVWYGPATSSGQACNGQPQAVTNGPPDTSCPPGKVPGLINGQTVCFTASDNNPAVKVETKTQSTTNPQGQTTTGPTTTTTTTDRGTGGKTVDTTTTNPDGSKTQSTEHSGPNDTRPDIKRFCDENPTSSICKASSWSGSCAAFQCDGDAVECAMALEMHKRNCSLFETPTSLSTLGNEVASGADPQASQNPALESNRQAVNLNGTLSQDTFLAQGGLADQQFVVSPRLTLTLPWSQLNPYLGLMGAIVIAFALIFAARIVIGAK
jgi:hypothetical protein